MRNLLVSMLCAVALSACGGAAAVDPLVGTWFAQITPTTTDNMTATLTFRSDRTYTLVHTQVDSSLAPMPGCARTQTDSGVYASNSSSGMTTLTMTPSAAGESVRTGCTNPADNGTGPGNMFSYAGVPYSIMGNTLTITSGSPTVFTRR